MKLKHTEKELSKAVKHLDEKVPPEPDIRCQIWEEEMDAVCCAEELPWVWCDEEWEAQEDGGGEEEDEGVGYNEFL